MVKTKIKPKNRFQFTHISINQSKLPTATTVENGTKIKKRKNVIISKSVKR